MRLFAPTYTVAVIPLHEGATPAPTLLEELTEEELLRLLPMEEVEEERELPVKEEELLELEEPGSVQLLCNACTLFRSKASAVCA